MHADESAAVRRADIAEKADARALVDVDKVERAVCCRSRHVNRADRYGADVELFARCAVRQTAGKVRQAKRRR